ncbi:MAG: ABC transporter permease [Elusimicrobiota bacterium]|jgi:phospholipid/cholesterol/gamma-HCH transport system permease protein|nr:ABC transporter permease [Elusimicrobiota bacterium]
MAIARKKDFLNELSTLWTRRLEGLGSAFLMTMETFKWILRGKISAKNTIDQMFEIGNRSMPIICLTSFCMGMVLALQSGTALTNMFNEPVFVGMLTGFSIVLELGPLITAIVVAGRVGAAITAELGSMKVTEQLDALYTLGTSPVQYLAVPRFIAIIFTLPFLVAFADVIGILGGCLVSVSTWDLSAYQFMSDITNNMGWRSVVHGLIKSVFYALIIVVVACYKGFSTRGGATGVGKAVTSAVMYSLVCVLVSDYFLTLVLVWLKIK